MYRIIFIFLVLFNLRADSQDLSDLAFGTSNNLDLITWNLQTFAKDDQTTIDSLTTAIIALDVDVIAIQEISNSTEFQTLLTQLNGYNGYHSTNTSMKLGYIYKSSLTINNIYTIYDNDTYNFAGRPPLVLSLNYNNQDFSIINVHLKCCGDGVLDLTNPNDEETRRFNGLNMLKTYIDQNLPSENVVVLGDYNDVLTDPLSNNVFSQFINDSVNYQFADFVIADGPSINWSYPTWPSHIDHILISSELNDEFNNSNNNVVTIPVDDYLLGGFNTYDALISDHLPVAISLDFNTLIYGCTRHSKKGKRDNR